MLMLAYLGQPSLWNQLEAARFLSSGRHTADRVPSCLLAFVPVPTTPGPGDVLVVIHLKPEMNSALVRKQTNQRPGGGTFSTRYHSKDLCSSPHSPPAGGVFHKK